MRKLFEFFRCERAIAATEFALILPLGVVLLLGTAELGTALLIDRKVTRATHVGADLVAQVDAVSSSDLDDVFKAMEAILLPYPLTVQITITSVYHDPDTDTQKVDWSVSHGGGTARTGTFTLPAGLTSKGDSVIVSEMTYDYQPLFNDFILDPLTITDVSYLKPRRTTKVAKN